MMGGKCCLLALFGSFLAYIPKNSKYALEGERLLRGCQPTVLLLWSGPLFIGSNPVSVWYRAGGYGPVALPAANSNAWNTCAGSISQPVVIRSYKTKGMQVISLLYLFSYDHIEVCRRIDFSSTVLVLQIEMFIIMYTEVPYVLRFRMSECVSVF
jgi:hypothetical protein